MGSSRSVKFFIALSLILTNSVVVLYFARDKFDLPAYIAEPISLLTLIFDQEKADNPELNTDTSKLHSDIFTEKQLTVTYQDQQSFQTLQPHQHVVNHVELADIRSVCFDKRPQANNKRIYSWIDSKGIQHLSDKPRAIDSDTPVTVAGTIQADAISINYSGNMPPFDVQQKIFSRVSANNKLFGKITPQELVKPVIINFRMFDDVKKYKAYQERIAPVLKLSNGFYMSSINESVVLMNKGESSINTAVHEAMHSINRHWFGHMSKWLNEGIAEYAEASHSKQALHSGWKKYLVKNGALELKELFESDRNGWDAQNSKMYSTSWAYVAFLVATNPNTLSRYLLEENINGCDDLTISDIERISAKPINMIQSEFDRWLHNI